MNPLWTARAIAAACGGTASADFTVQGVAFDSREVTKGDLFIAMKGESADGHAFIDKAIARSEEHTSELQSLMRISYVVFCLQKKILLQTITINHSTNLSRQFCKIV